MAGAHRKPTFISPGGGAHLAWFGERLRYLAVSEQTAARFALAVLSIPPGQELAPHIRHREHVGVYVLSGELTVRVGCRTLVLECGSFLAIAPGGARQFVNAGAEAVEVLFVAGPAGFEEFQFRTGVPLSAADESFAPMTADDRATLEELAPGYGMEPSPSAVAFQAEPAIRLTLPDEGQRITVLGDVYRFLAVSEDTGGRYAIWHATAAPGSGPPLHSHSREDEAIFVLTGTLSVEADGINEPVGPGGFVHLPSGMRHRIINETPEPVTALVFVAPAGLERMFDSVSQAGLPPPGPQDITEILRLVDAAPKFGLELYMQ